MPDGGSIDMKNLHSAASYATIIVTNMAEQFVGIS